MEELYLIWCKRHQGDSPVILWWCANSNGYTRYLNQAGRYTKDKAERIVGGGDYMVPEDAALKMARTCVHDDELLKYLHSTGVRP